MPDDTTLGLLRRLEAAGAMPEGWFYRYDDILGARLMYDERVRHTAYGSCSDGTLGWIRPWSDAFIVALQRKLASMGVTTLLAPAPEPDAEPQWWASDEHWPWTFRVGCLIRLGGSGPEGLIRAALAVLETR